MKTSLENLAIGPSNSNSDLDPYSTIIEKNCFLYFFNILIFETKINIIKFKFWNIKNNENVSKLHQKQLQHIIHLGTIILQLI